MRLACALVLAPLLPMLGALAAPAADSGLFPQLRRLLPPPAPSQRAAAEPAEQAAFSPTGEADSKPQAVLVRNPRAAAGEPPFALTDENGEIQRLVEPSPGVDLDPFVGRILRVAHDTGPTLLASQLELPDDPNALPGPIDAPPVYPSKPTPLAPSNSATGVGVTRTQFLGPGPPGSSREKLPEPIVLEEVVGEPSGPIIGSPIVGGPPGPSGVDGLQFPSAVASPGAAAVSGPCLGCGSVVGGACPNCALVGAPRRGLVGGALVGSLLDPPGTPRGLDFSVEALWLRVHDSSGISGGNDFELGSRWELGLNGDTGQRLALRYMEYDSGLVGGRLGMETLDLEYQRQFPLGAGGAWGVGGGVRWAQYDEVLPGGGGTALGIAYDNSFGPLLGLYARVPAFGKVDGVAVLRQSLQFGDSRVGGGTGTFGSFGMTELQLGLERRRQRRFGQTTLRAAFEAQNWTGVGNAPLSSDRGLVGFSLGLGLRR